jgi:hypothetical protein
VTIDAIGAFGGESVEFSGHCGRSLFYVGLLVSPSPLVVLQDARNGPVRLSQRWLWIGNA